MAICLSELSTHHVDSKSFTDQFATDARSLKIAARRSEIGSDMSAIGSDTAAMAVDRAAMAINVRKIEANNSEIGSDRGVIAVSTTEIVTNRVETRPHQSVINRNIRSIRYLRLKSVVASPGKAEYSAVRGVGILKAHSSGEIA